MKPIPILLAALVLLALGCVSQPPANSNDTTVGGPGQTITVDMKNFEFQPSTLNIQAGTTLHFTNSDSFAHDVHVQRNGADVFPRTQVNAGGSVDVVIGETGDYDLICDRHLPGMAGHIHAE